MHETDHPSATQINATASTRTQETGLGSVRRSTRSRIILILLKINYELLSLYKHSKPKRFLALRFKVNLFLHLYNMANNIFSPSFSPTAYDIPRIVHSITI